MGSFGAISTARVSKRFPLHGTACSRARYCINVINYYDGGIPTPNQKWWQKNIRSRDVVFGFNHLL